MRILFVNEKAGYFGGVEQNIADTAEGLRLKGASCFLTYGQATDRSFDAYRAIFESALACREISDEPESSSLPFAEVVQRVSPDVVYIHKVKNIRFMEPFLGEVRYVRMVHDHDLCCPRRHKYHLLSNRVCRHRAGVRCFFDGAFVERHPGAAVGLKYSSIAAKLKEMRRNYRLDSLLVGSRFMREELVQNGFAWEKVHVLAPAVKERTVPLAPVSESPMILYVGQLIRGKGVDLLLRALKRVSSDFQAILVGTGNAEGRLRALCAELELNGRVHFRGWMNHAAVGSLYAQARVVVVPSRWPEPFGMIGLEAMHHARPVVAFDVGGIVDWLADGVTGFLVPEQNIVALAEAIERLLVDSELATVLGENGSVRVHKHFSFAQYIDRLLQVLGGKA